MPERPGDSGDPTLSGDTVPLPQEWPDEGTAPLPPLTDLAASPSGPAEPLPPIDDEAVEAARAELAILLPGRFTPLTRLGAGGMGEVWRAHDKELDRDIAVKILRKEHAARLDARFVNEARATAGLQHPGIVPVYEMGRLADGRHYYAMQEVRGTSLADAVRAVHEASGDRAWVEADGWTFLGLLDAFAQVCDTVAFAHTRGVLHRDLKPANVMLGRFGEVRVVDWGLARGLGEPMSDISIQSDTPLPVRPNEVAGTVGYMAPEQAAGQNERVGVPADIYGLGGVLHAILVGYRPGSGLGAGLDAPRVPRALAELCRACLAPAPEDRPGSAAAVAREVRAWMEDAARLTARRARIRELEAKVAALGPREREEVRDALLALFEPDGTPVARPASLLHATGAQRLLAMGLATRDGDRVQLADPGLVEWGRVRAWMDADGTSRRFRHDLLLAARTWDERGRRGEDLWVDDRLREARRWHEERPGRLSPVEEAFLGAGDRAQRRLGRTRVAFVAATVACLVVVAVASVAMWIRSDSAREELGRAWREVRVKALEAESARFELAGDPHATIAYELARASLEESRSHLDVDRVVAERGPRFVVDGDWTEILAVSADGTRVAVGRPNGGATVFSLPQLRTVAELPQATRVALGPTEGELAWVGRERDLHLALDDAAASQPADDVAWWGGPIAIFGGRATRIGPSGTAQEAVPAVTAPVFLHALFEPADAARPRVRALDGSIDTVLPAYPGGGEFGHLPDGSRAWVVDQGGALHLWDARDGTLVAERDDGGFGPSATAADADGRRLFVANYDNRVRVYDLADGRLVSTYSGHSTPAVFVALGGHHAPAVTLDQDAEVHVWDPETGRPLAAPQPFDVEHPPTAVRLGGGTVVTVDTRSLSAWMPPGLSSAAEDVCEGYWGAVDVAGRRLYSGDLRRPCVTRMPEGQAVPLPATWAWTPVGEGASPLFFAPGKLPEMEALAPGIQVVDRMADAWVREGAARMPVRRGMGGIFASGPDGPAWVAAIRGDLRRLDTTADGRWLVVETASAVEVLAADSGATAVRLDYSQEEPPAWTIDGDTLFAVQDDGSVAERALVGGSWRVLVPAGGPEVRRIAVGPGKVALGYADGRVAWFRADGTPLGQTSLADGFVTALAFDPAGTRLAVGNGYRNLSVWHLESAHLALRAPLAERGRVLRLAWLAGDELLVAGDHEARRWTVPPRPLDAAAATNLRVCRDDLRVTAVPAAAGPLGAWAPAELCGGDAP